MSFAFRVDRLRTVGSLLSVGLLCASAAPASAQAPAGTVEPIYRTAREEPAAEVASRVVPAAAQPPFNLEQQAGEHPLMPALRVAKQGLEHLDATIQDYQAILYKQERIAGELQPQEVAFVKVRHKPFSVHMFFLAPHKGRECVYVDGPEGAKGKMYARDCGLRRKFGVWELDPDGPLAMKGQKYPITKLGVRNLTAELVMVATNDVNFGECDVTTSQTVIGPRDGEKRAVTLIEAVHPTPRRNFRFHKAQVFIDNELKVPIRYAAYLWPENPGEEPPLEEAYTYVNLKINNGFTDADFDRENAALFKD